MQACIWARRANTGAVHLSTDGCTCIDTANCHVNLGCLSGFRDLLPEDLLLRLLLADVLLPLLLLLVVSAWLLRTADSNVPSFSCSSMRAQHAMGSRTAAMTLELTASICVTGRSCHGWARPRTSASQYRIHGTPCACSPCVKPWHAALQACAHCSTKRLYAPAGCRQHQEQTSGSEIRPGLIAAPA
jgi:hypothetical protein